MRNDAHSARWAWLAVAGISAFMVLFAVGCGSDDSTSSDSADVPTELGEGEGEVNLIAWAGYVEDGSTDPKVDWVTDFEKETGCQVNVKIGNTSDEMVQLMRTGDYDGVSASGDATLRLIDGGDVAPVNTDLLENYGDIYDGLKDQPYNSVDGQMYGAPHGRGANLLMYDTEDVNPAPTSLSAVFDPAEASKYSGKVTAYDSPIWGSRTPTSSTRISSTPPSTCSSSRTRTSASTGPTTPRRSRRSRTATARSARRGRSSTSCCRPTTSPWRRCCRRRARPVGRTHGWSARRPSIRTACTCG